MRNSQTNQTANSQQAAYQNAQRAQGSKLSDQYQYQNPNQQLLISQQQQMAQNNQNSNNPYAVNMNRPNYPLPQPANGLQRPLQAYSRPPIDLPKQQTPTKSASSSEEEQSDSEQNSVSHKSSRSSSSSSAKSSSNSSRNSSSEKESRSSSRESNASKSGHSSNKSSSSSRRSSASSSASKDNEEQETSDHEGEYQGKDGQWFKSREQLAETREQVAKLNKELVQFEVELNKLFPFIEISNKVFSGQSTSVLPQSSSSMSSLPPLPSHQFNTNSYLGNTNAFADTQQMINFAPAQSQKQRSMKSQNEPQMQNYLNDIGDQAYRQTIQSENNNPINTSYSSSKSHNNQSKLYQFDQQASFPLQTNPILSDQHSRRQSNTASDTSNPFRGAQQSNQPVRKDSINSNTQIIAQLEQGQLSSQSSPFEGEAQLNDNNFSFKKIEQRFLRTKKN